MEKAKKNNVDEQELASSTSVSYLLDGLISDKSRGTLARNVKNLSPSPSLDDGFNEPKWLLEVAI